MFTPDEWRSILLLVIIGVLYLLRNTNTFFRVIWKVVATFFIVLFATLMANYVKKELKEWWNKD
jgi:cell division protein FtsW (lipid II flippase)